ncbi:hypothetical protein [Ideonella sp. A 288]|uniref:hypothetical protein n=1 Tax=Ideonella sp. A 288 TaxID=1962181 RepID=UPI000B4B3F15|nr:hypothetical protein [Ideonella sp. A 288]
MNPIRLTSLAAASALAVLLGGCGGGDSSPTAHPLASAAATAQPSALPGADARRRAQAVLGTINVTQLLNWAEQQYPALFPAGPANQSLTSGGVTYTLRYYDRTKTYLGVSTDGTVYALGAFTSNNIQSFGKMSDYTCQVSPSLCVEDPPVNGSLNECIDPAAASLPTGFRVELVYTYTGVITGDQTVQSVILGPGTFEGQSAIEVKSTTSGTNTIEGFPVTTTTEVRTFEQAATNGLTRTLGSNIESTQTFSVPGIPSLGSSKSKIVYNPATLNTEFTLKVGESLTKTEAFTTTIFTPVPGSTSATGSNRYTFETKESITLSNGKRFDTCRYRMTSLPDNTSTLTWLIVGKGVMVKSTGAVKDGGTQTIELKSGQYNGQQL